MSEHSIFQKATNSTPPFQFIWECSCGKDFTERGTAEYHVAMMEAHSKPYLTRLLDDPGLLRTHLYGDLIKDDRNNVLYELPKGFTREHRDDPTRAIINHIKGRLCVCGVDIGVSGGLCPKCRARVVASMERWTSQK